MSKEQDKIIDEIEIAARRILRLSVMESKFEDISGEIIDLCKKYKSLPKIS